MFWLQNMWSAIENERRARETLLTSIAQSYVTKDTIDVITGARERQIQDIISRIERVTDRMITNEQVDNQLSKDHAKLEASVAEIRALVGRVPVRK
jgi:hypothetical protein